MATLKSLVNETTNIKNELVECHATLKNNLIEKDVECSEDDKLAVLVDKVKDMPFIEGYSKLPKWFKAEFAFKDYVFSCEDMIAARGYLTSSAVGDKIYVIGGSDGNFSSRNECYDTATNTWTTKASMTTARDD